MKYNNKQQTGCYGGCIMWVILVAVIWMLASCSKHDYSYMNTDRRPQVVIVSERYTNPPMIYNGIWKPYKIVYDSLSRDTDADAYRNIRPDTLISSCSIDKIDTNFKIEIRKYKIQ